MNIEFHLRYRPQRWEQVLGQKAAVLSLRKALDSKRHRVFLFVGPSGVGKTTLARLVAKQVGANSRDNIIEVCGSTHTGIDNIRELIERLSYSTLDGTPRCVIVDEVSYISKPAFGSLLKILEEPPAGIYFCLCTTEADRIPQNIKTRCAAYTLKPVPDELILELLQRIKEEQQLRISEEGLEMIVAASGGAPRQALVYLAECGDFKKLTSIKEVLSRDDESSAQIIDICRVLLRIASGTGSRLRWGELAALIRAVDMSAESARIVVLNYMGVVALNNDERKAMAALTVMSNFQEPFLDRAGKAPLTMACARVWNGGDE